MALLTSCELDSIGAARAAFESSSEWIEHSRAATLVGAGDIGLCGSDAAEATARILDTIPGVVFMAGDGAYPWGTADEYAACYEPNWGRHKGRTRPSPGNSDYESPAAYGYYGYFGGAAGDPARGYYSFHVGDWLVLILNSSVDIRTGSRQLTWLRRELARFPARCSVAIWHVPRFSSGKEHGNNDKLAGAWRLLYDAGTDVVINGHDHGYERFAPQNPEAQLDSARGIRQFIVGTGGGNLNPFVKKVANSEMQAAVHGVLALRLQPDSYAWHFVPVSDLAQTDTGSAQCH